MEETYYYLQHVNMNSRASALDLYHWQFLAWLPRIYKKENVHPSKCTSAHYLLSSAA